MRITIELEEMGQWMRDFHYVAVINNLEVDVQRMWEAFNYEYKYTQREKCLDKMYDYIFCQINDVLESKRHYNKVLKNDLIYAQVKKEHFLYKGKPGAFLHTKGEDKNGNK